MKFKNLSFTITWKCKASGKQIKKSYFLSFLLVLFLSISFCVWVNMCVCMWIRAFIYFQLISRFWNAKASVENMSLQSRTIWSAAFFRNHAKGIAKNKNTTKHFTTYKCKNKPNDKNRLWLTFAHKMCAPCFSFLPPLSFLSIVLALCYFATYFTIALIV